MTQEEKQLLLIDLSARLSYGVCVRHQDNIVDENGEETGEFVYVDGYLCDVNTCDEQTTSMIIMSGEDEGYEHHNFLEETKPYLRQMSSMTEEEIKTYRTLQDTAYSYHYEFGDIVDDLEYFDNDVSLDYLNSIHMDYRGLIEKGLALEAPEGMYKTE